MIKPHFRWPRESRLIDQVSFLGKGQSGISLPEDLYRCFLKHRAARFIAPASIIRAKLARFLENHDEPSAASRFPGRSASGGDHHVSVAGLRFLHQGQFEGVRSRQPSRRRRLHREPGASRLQVPFPEFRGKQVRLADVMGTEIYDRDGRDLVTASTSITHPGSSTCSTCRRPDSSPKSRPCKTFVSPT